MTPVASRAAAALEPSHDADPAKLYRQQLAQERDRLSLLLDITNRIASNLDLHELLRAISATLRQVMECDGGVVVVLSGEESGQPWVHALDFPESDGFVSQELFASRGGLGGKAFETLLPVIANRPRPVSSGSRTKPQTDRKRHPIRLLYSAREPGTRPRSPWPRPPSAALFPSAGCRVPWPSGGANRHRH